MQFIIPTSGTTAILVPVSEGVALAWGIAGTAVLAAGAYSAWSLMLMAVAGRAVKISRWVLVGVSAGLTLAMWLLFAFMFGEVTFNGEVTTAWNFVIEAWVAIVLAACCVALTSLCARDVLRGSAFPGSLRVWWAAGIALAATYGAVAGWYTMSGAPWLLDVVYAGGALLAVSAAAGPVLVFASRLSGRREGIDGLSGGDVV